MITCNLVTFTYAKNFQQTRLHAPPRVSRDYNNKRAPYSGTVETNRYVLPVASTCTAIFKRPSNADFDARQTEVHAAHACLAHYMLYFRDVNDGVRAHARTHARTHVSVTLAISTARGNTYRL